MKRWFNLTRYTPDHLNHRIRWSSLARLGNSRIAKLTIFAPIIGYLLLFNAELAPYLRITVPTHDASSNIVTWLHDQRLMFLYFGLVLLGAAAGLFAMFAPEVAQDHKSAGTFVSAMEAHQTPSLVQAHLEEIFMRGFVGHPYVFRTSRSFPFTLAQMMDQLVREAFRAVDAEGVDLPMTALGNPAVDEILEMIYARRRVDSALWEPLWRDILDKPKDVFSIFYQALDYSNFPMRMVVCVAFYAGFALVLLPTITTSILVLRYGV